MRMRIAVILTALGLILGVSAGPASARPYYQPQDPIQMRHHWGILTEFGHGADTYWYGAWPRGDRRARKAWAVPRVINLIVNPRGYVVSCANVPFAYEGTKFFISIKNPYTGYRWKREVYVPCRHGKWWAVAVDVRSAPDFHFWSGCDWTKWPKISVTAKDIFWTKKDKYYRMGPRRFHNPRC